ncbi:hypothetical protein [Bradyrhizobium sp. AT1]|uniref:hypothetical protein n=1 Tax=Bradyrhizobium sp. AT1 TaxID=574934 RepID=UPI001FD9999E|nr:hypothetical protein [Bradyrhizobium sp. AT1]
MLAGIGSPLHEGEVPGHAVVVVEEAVADEQHGLWEVRPERGDLRLGLRLRIEASRNGQTHREHHSRKKTHHGFLPDF